jgi:hypothetical protein
MVLASLTAGEAVVDQETMMLVGAIVAVVALLIVIGAWYYTSKQRRVQLRQRFGPEYDRTVEAVGEPGKAEAILSERAARVDRFKLRPLTQDQADAFSREWHRIQTKFVDDPEGAVTEADQLVTQVMTARGYPLEDFERRAEDVSVDHPNVVENYRTARTLVTRRSRGEAGTEELRQAVVNYRSLFDDLLEVHETRHRRAS